MPLAQAKPLLNEAEATPRQQIAAAGESKAWLNLALFYIDQGRATDASLAAMEYLNREPDPAVAELIRQRFGFPHDEDD